VLHSSRARQRHFCRPLFLFLTRYLPYLPLSPPCSRFFYATLPSFQRRRELTVPEIRHDGGVVLGPLDYDRSGRGNSLSFVLDLIPGPVVDLESCGSFKTGISP